MTTLEKRSVQRVKADILSSESFGVVLVFGDLGESFLKFGAIGVDTDNLHVDPHGITKSSWL